MINLIAIRHAAQPADREHRFGHGKAEPLAGLGQSAFIAGSAVFLLVQAGARLVQRQPISNEAIGVAVMLLSIVMTLGSGPVATLGDPKNRVARDQRRRPALKSDLLVNLGVMTHWYCHQFGWRLADPLFAITVAIYIVDCAWQIFSGSFHLLMERELPKADRAKMRTIASAHPSVVSHPRSAHPILRTQFIQFHLELDGDLTLINAHTIANSVMRDIQHAFPNAEVLIHQDPYKEFRNRARSSISDLIGGVSSTESVRKVRI